MSSSSFRAKLPLFGLVFVALNALLLSASCAGSVDEEDDCQNACFPDEVCEDGECVTACTDGRLTCNGSCADIQHDPFNCGACGLACAPGVSCIAGVCTTGCPTNLALCNETCVDLQLDPNNCGACNVSCSAGLSCVQGICNPCPPGQSLCNGACVNTNVDPDNCGGCNSTCDPGVPCIGGTCDDPCNPGQTICNGACVDTTTNNQHCGFCNNPCTASQTCQGGTCACVGGACGLCSITNLGSTVPQTTSGSTVGAVDSYSPTCTGTGAGDAAYSFTAPSAGTYIFNTTGSNYDTVLATMATACFETDCNDDTGGVQSELTLTLAQGETVYVIVDGFSGSTGSYVLNVAQPAVAVCPTGIIGGTLPQTLSGSTLGAGSAVTPSCNFGNNGDVTFQFTAPATGSYAFDTFGSGLNTVMSILDGGCTGVEIACNDDANPNGESRVTANLVQGQTVIVSVEGYAGSAGTFVFHASEIAPPVCPTGTLGSAVPQTVTGSTVSQGDAITPNCGFVASADNSYTFTAPSAGTYTFDTTGSSFNTVLSARDGGCAGIELACNDDWQFTTDSRIAVGLSAGQTVVVAIDGSGGEEGSYVLNVGQFSCPVLDLGSTVPQTVSGSTVGLIDDLAPSCVGGGSPEVTYGFTAPSAGTYTFDTFGSAYDTALHVHDATCLGPELACNDDTGGLQSQVTVSLAAGQTVVIVVDGYSGASGSFVLNIQ